MKAIPQTHLQTTLDTADMALVGLLAELKAVGYRFVTPTPATHARIWARPEYTVGSTLHDLLGWSLPVARGDLPPIILGRLEALGMIEERGHMVRSRLRVSSLDNDLYYHSAYPTTSNDSVFFGPDSYRFTDQIRIELGNIPPRGDVHIVDIGTGAGVGAVTAARCCPGARITMTDINPSAMRFAAINTLAAGVQAEGVLASDLAPIDAPIDIILANPPYIVDPAGRDYRNGGSMHGAEIALNMARIAAARLGPRGRFLLYTGSAVIKGKDPLARALTALAERAGFLLRYREIDPDVFGEELSNSAYANVDRIAVVVAVLERPEQT